MTVLDGWILLDTRMTLHRADGTTAELTARACCGTWQLPDGPCRRCGAPSVAEAQPAATVVAEEPSRDPAAFAPLVSDFVDAMLDKPGEGKG